MNPREFCREADYHTAIILTYSFNPLFFERIVLPELWRGGTGDILIIADHQQIMESIPNWNGQLRFLGRRYQLVTAKVPGIFHPKIILRIGKEGGAIYLGSGNITSSGWGGNSELASAWSFGPGLTDRGLWVPALINQIADWIPDHLRHDVIHKVQEAPWMLSSESYSLASPVILNDQDRSLSEKLSERFSGRRFTDVNILTGSTDENGAFLKWLHDNFGVNQATIIVDKAHVYFDSRQLAKLPVKYSLFHANDMNTMHAKLYHLRGPDESAVIMGSANCSSAAWLVPLSRGGNTESITIFDDISEDFNPLLEIFDGDNLEPIDLELNPTSTRTEVKRLVPRISISELCYEEPSGILRVAIDTNGKAIASATVLIDSNTIELRACDDPPGLWVCEYAGFENRNETIFVVINVRLEDNSIHSARWWINSISELRHASHGRRVADNLKNLKYPQTSNDQNKMVNELHMISVSLLSEPDGFPDPKIEHNQEGKKKPKAADPVNPDDLVKSINELEQKPPDKSASRGTAPISLAGVMRALFEMDDDDSITDEIEAADEPKLENNNDDKEGKKKKQKKSGPKRKSPNKGPKSKLHKQMDKFLVGFSARPFAEKATATQLVQAASYPLAVGLLGCKGGWVDPQQAGRWAQQITTVLFHKEYGNGNIGLLNHIHKRYKSGNNENQFIQIVGDGTLWVAFLFSLADLKWEINKSGFQKCLLFREIYHHRTLLAATDLGRMKLLFSRLDTRKTEAVRSLGPSASKLIEKLEETLKSKWESIYSAQSEARIAHQPGDLLWRDEVGWAESREEAAYSGPIRTAIPVESGQPFRLNPDSHSGPIRTLPPDNLRGCSAG